MRSATFLTAASEGLKNGFTSTPSMRSAWSKYGESVFCQSVMPAQLPVVKNSAGGR